MPEQTKKMPARSFFGKVETEGGYLDALDYGLSTDGYDLPEDVKEAWRQCVYAFATLSELIADFQATAEEAGVDSND